MTNLHKETGTAKQLMAEGAGWKRWGQLITIIVMLLRSHLIQLAGCFVTNSPII